MKVYAFDLMPWPHLDEPSCDPDPNALFDPARGQRLMGLFQFGSLPHALACEHIKRFAATVLPELERG